MSSVPPTSPFVSPNANKIISNIDYTKTYPTTERVIGATVQTGIALGIGATLGPKASAVAFGVFDFLDVRGKTENLARKVTADKAIHFADGSKDTIQHPSMASTVWTSHSSCGKTISKTEIRNGSHIHTQFKDGKPSSTTCYPAQGGSYTVGADGKLTIY